VCVCVCVDFSSERREYTHNQNRQEPFDFVEILANKGV